MTTFARSFSPSPHSLSMQSISDTLAVVLPRTAPGRAHAMRALERAGFRVDVRSSVEEAANAAAGDPRTLGVTELRVENDAQASQQGAHGHWLSGRTLAEIERQAFLDTLEETGGNRAETARRLGVSEKTVYNKLRAWGMLTPRA